MASLQTGSSDRQIPLYSSHWQTAILAEGCPSSQASGRGKDSSVDSRPYYPATHVTSSYQLTDSTAETPASPGVETSVFRGPVQLQWLPSVSGRPAAVGVEQRRHRQSAWTAPSHFPTN